MREDFILFVIYFATYYYLRPYASDVRIIRR